NHDGQRIVVNVDRLDRIARNIGIGGDHDGDGVADVVDAVAGEHGVLWRFQIGNRGGAGDVAAFVVDVGAGEDRDDAGQVPGGGGIDPSDSRVRVRAAQDGCVQQPRQPDVIDVGANPFDQAGIFDPLHRTADVWRFVVSHGGP